MRCHRVALRIRLRKPNRGRSLTSENVLERLAHLFVDRGVPEHIQIECHMRIGDPVCFDAAERPIKLQDELLKREVFYTVKKARVLIERWRNSYNHARPDPPPVRPRQIGSRISWRFDGRTGCERVGSARSGL